MTAMRLKLYMGHAGLANPMLSREHGANHSPRSGKYHAAMCAALDCSHSVSIPATMPFKMPSTTSRTRLTRCSWPNINSSAWRTNALRCLVFRMVFVSKSGCNMIAAAISGQAFRAAAINGVSPLLDACQSHAGAKDLLFNTRHAPGTSQSSVVRISNSAPMTTLKSGVPLGTRAARARQQNANAPTRPAYTIKSAGVERETRLTR
eukprot:CAMPEP_0176057378 /NCGR_PEP_ID=MMETSP0120_2-20121206/28578_1 /TAXON_ID=160619 /ORGANISM="Kryptoperidinium foliaceum, Strain CCMP 1326" /LENGTH=205 /DNA_ID=CAMNT_0017390889 /DNA_START=488 /DNA_END=1105 /DNA_ORIENTATION=+